MHTDQAIIRAYMEANKRVLATASQGQQIPVTILNTFLGVYHWGLDNPNNTNEPNTLEYLADKLGISPTTISQHMRYLGERYREGKEGLELVETEINPLNRRQKTFKLTPKGRAVIDQVIYIIGGARG